MTYMLYVRLVHVGVVQYFGSNKNGDAEHCRRYRALSEMPSVVTMCRSCRPSTASCSCLVPTSTHGYQTDLAYRPHSRFRLIVLHSLTRLCRRMVRAAQLKLLSVNAVASEQASTPWSPDGGKSLSGSRVSFELSAQSSKVLGMGVLILAVGAMESQPALYFGPL